MIQRFYINFQLIHIIANYYFFAYQYLFYIQKEDYQNLYVFLNKENVNFQILVFNI